MALSKCTVPTDVIGSLGTTPQDRGLTTQEFKDKFDEMPEGIKAYLNDTLTVEVDAHTADNMTAHTPETPIAPTLINSWLNLGAGHTEAGYWKDTVGIVHIRGVISEGATGNTAFILPVGYRPAKIIGFAATSGVHGDAYVWINPLGEVVIQIGSTIGVFLDNIAFRAEV